MKRTYEALTNDQLADLHRAALGLTPAARSRLEGDAPALPPVPEGNKVVAIRERFQAAT